MARPGFVLHRIRGTMPYPRHSLSGHFETALVRHSEMSSAITTVESIDFVMARNRLCGRSFDAGKHQVGTAAI